MPASQLTRALVCIAVNIVPCTNLLQVVSVYVKAAVLWVHVSENFQKCHHMIQGRHTSVVLKHNMKCCHLCR